MKIGMGNIFGAGNSILTSNFSQIAYLTLFQGFFRGNAQIWSFLKNCRISMKIGTGNNFRARNSNLTSNLGQIAYLTLFQGFLGKNAQIWSFLVPRFYEGELCFGACPSVRPSVRPSVTSFFSRTVHSIFLKFCMKVSIHKEKKRTFSFFQENSRLAPRGPERVKIPQNSSK